MEEYKSFTASNLFYTLLVFIFVWGSLWVSTNGLAIVRSSGEDNAQNSNLSGAVSLPVYFSVNSPTSTKSFDSELTIMIGGDVMLDRGIRLVGQKYGYDSLFATITPLFKEADIAVVNLEGPITSNKSKTVMANGKTNESLTFTFDTKVAEALAKAGITMVSLANNHTDNFGSAGLAETKDWLSKTGIQWFGDPWNSTSTEAIILKNGIQVAFVGYHSFQPGFERVLDSVKSLTEQGNFVIVMPHWDQEYATSSSPLVRAQARALVSAGAGAVVGAHPHVVLEHAWMGDIPVFYSLGNLLFDQHFSPEVMKGNIVRLHLVRQGKKVVIDDIKIYETSIASRRGIEVDMEPVDF